LKLAIIGSRTFTDYNLLSKTVLHYFSRFNEIEGWDEFLISEIVSGGAVGADGLGAKFAREYDIKLTEFIPDWQKYGRSAGFKRNEEIISAADFVLTFWDGLSRGTENSIDWARKQKKPTLIIYF